MITTHTPPRPAKAKVERPCSHVYASFERNFHDRLSALDKASLQLLASRYVSIGAVAAGPSRRDLEEAWHQRLNRARSRYEDKVAIRKEMLAERSVWLINLQPDPDGRFALHLALQEECAARTEYMRILKLFMKLILHRAPPEEDPGSDRVQE